MRRTSEVPYLSSRGVTHQSPADPAAYLPQRIVIVGGGFVGFTVARNLERGLRPGEAEVVLIDGTGAMTYSSFLPEVAGGLIEPRRLVIPLRQVLRRTRIVTGMVTEVDREARTVRVTLPDGTTHDEDYDQLVLAPGSVPRIRPIPGLAEHAVGFGTLQDATFLRDQVLGRIALAADTSDEHARQQALTFVLIGGGYTGVEAIAELHGMAVAAVRRYPNLDVGDMRWELIEAADEIMPELPARLAAYARGRLEQSGISVRLRTEVTSVAGGLVTLSDGARYASDTVVWTAGVRANPLLAHVGVPVDVRGRLHCTTTLQVQDADRLWSAGDGAAVPDLAATLDLKSATVVPLCGPTAQHAVRQAKVLARNLVATLRGRPLRDYRHADAGAVASLGLHRGVARIYGVPMRGFVAWAVHRAYHLLMVPTWARRVRVAADWTAALLGRRDLAPLPVVASRPVLIAGATTHSRLTASEPGSSERTAADQIVADVTGSAA
ncbi:NAD(P)/FAD-dependent oxidoreductase [Occultella kanbiaonis]|uniref:NAD(P)/FAD-dependent oxidoreductase n=1 Tax=Occultella kanbiaonis TaxID=2675754 RepID=UPI0013D4AB5F|nr:NAD(P)/FAD-dependent oxidoreductase [Occultella kanbiaonis]